MGRNWSVEKRNESEENDCDEDNKFEYLLYGNRRILLDSSQKDAGTMGKLKHEQYEGMRRSEIRKI